MRLKFGMAGNLARKHGGLFRKSNSCGRNASNRFHGKLLWSKVPEQKAKHISSLCISSKLFCSARDVFRHEFTAQSTNNHSHRICRLKLVIHPSLWHLYFLKTVCFTKYFEASILSRKYRLSHSASSQSAIFTTCHVRTHAAQFIHEILTSAKCFLST